MSTYLTKQQQLQLQSFLLALLYVNLDTVSWASFWNPNMHSNRGLNKDDFKLITKEVKDILKFLMTEFSVTFLENSIIFPEGFEENIPTIVSELMRQIPVRVDESVAEEFPHDGCGGGAVAVSPISSHVCGAEECDPAASDVSCEDEQSGFQQHVHQICPDAGKCLLYKTWGGCRNIHHEPERGNISTLRGRVIIVCRNGPACPSGDRCSFPHPANPSCVIECRTLQSGTNVYLVCVCQFFLKERCNNKRCPYAHLSKEVVDRAIERKKSAFNKRDGGKPVISSSACSHDEVPRLAGNFTDLSMERKCHQNSPFETEDWFGCGGIACDVSIENSSKEQCSCEPPQEKIFDILDTLFMHHQPQAQSAPVAPSESQFILSSFGEWNEFIDPTTGLSYYTNKKTNEVTIANPRDLIRDACFAVSCQAFAEQNSASSVVACQAFAEQNSDS
jgi:hypothetical protein